MARLAGVAHRTALHQVFTVHHLGLDETALEVGVNRAGGKRTSERKRRASKAAPAMAGK
jgi:hypothetical protein